MPCTPATIVHYVASRVGAGIEMLGQGACARRRVVASRVGAGIEIDFGGFGGGFFAVASRVGAGIEIPQGRAASRFCPSRPVWARGLK